MMRRFALRARALGPLSLSRSSSFALFTVPKREYVFILRLRVG